MSDQCQEGWIGRGYFHLFQAPFGAAVAKKNRPCALSWSSGAAGAAQVPYWSLPLQQWQRCQCNASMIYRALNSLIDTINDNIFFFNCITLLHMLLADCCMPWHREWCTMEAVGWRQLPWFIGGGLCVLPSFHLGKACSDVSSPKSDQQPTTYPHNYLHE